jgi:hypothetical protein
VRRLAGLILRVRLFISSYAPLFAIFALRFQSWQASAVCSVVAALGVLTLLALLHRAKRIQPDPHRLASVSDRGPEVAGYLATYLLPFVTAPVPPFRELVAYLMLIVVVGVIYVRSDMIQINPLLYLFGYRVWAVTTGDGWSGYLVARQRPRTGAVILAVRLGNTVAVERANERGMAS